MCTSFLKRIVILILSAIVNSYFHVIITSIMCALECAETSKLCEVMQTKRNRNRQNISRLQGCIAAKCITFELIHVSLNFEIV